MKNNLSVNPMFVNSDSGDYHLQMFSPVIDAGAPWIYDIDGSRSDIGLYGGPYGTTYEYIDYPPLPVNEIKDSITTDKIILSWEYNTEADFSHYQVTKEYNGSGIIETETADTSIYIDYVPSQTETAKYIISSVDNQGNISDGKEKLVILSGVKKLPEGNPGYYLHNNYPNPFNPSTKIIYHLKEKSEVKLTVYDVKGEIIEELKNETEAEGWHEVNYNPGKRGEKISSGIYLYVLEVRKGNRIVYSDLGKMVYLK